MTNQSLSTREMHSNEFELMVDYFLNADSKYLIGMGVDKDKLPSKKDWLPKLISDFEKPIEEKEFYYIIWEIDDKPIGHSNLTNINFGKSAKMHLHIWNNTYRQVGIGTKLILQTIPYYFNNLKLEKLICEPYAENPAPNKILKKIGFKFIKKYHTTPGWVAFYQVVNRYEMLLDGYRKHSNYNDSETVETSVGE